MAIINYAHRGASAYYPENTLRSFYAGLECGADGMETDIQRSRDGILVLHHDDTLDRVAGRPGRVCDYTFAELHDMDFGAFKGSRFKGERIVRLDTFLEHFGRRNLTLALEIKQPGIEADCLELVNANRCRGDVIFTSFIWDSIAELRRLDSEIRLGFLTRRIEDNVLTLLEKHGIRQICPMIEETSRRDMDLALSRGFSVRFWGVKDEDLMRRAIALGGDGMTVNFPDALAAALKERGKNS